VEESQTLAILVGGGPAPGINGVIAAATVHARLKGRSVLGLRNGFEWIMQGNVDHVTPLTIDDASRIHFRGGSYLGTSRANPSLEASLLEQTVSALRRLNVSHLVTIGGDDTAFSAMKLSEHAAGVVRVVHVPKTIDNDLDLPPYLDTFGFQTARQHGTEIVRSLMADAETIGGWYLVVAMGRTAGHLALGIGKATGAQLTLIPEQYAAAPRLDSIVDTIVGAILKRLRDGRQDGVVIIAEGLALAIEQSDLAGLGEVERDEHGHPRVAEVDIGQALKLCVAKRLRGLGLRAHLVSKNVGYELRSADPIAFDLAYTRDLGDSAAAYLLGGGDASMMSIQHGQPTPIPFAALIDRATGRTRVRLVDVSSPHYTIADNHMVRLRRADFDDPQTLAALAATARTSVERFRREFEHLVADGSSNAD
jgi:6-phosphofructokinase 1